MGARFIQIDQSLCETGIVVQTCVEMGFPYSIRAIAVHGRAVPSSEEKIRGFFTGFQVSAVAEYTRPFSHGADHHAVPGGEYLVVEAGRDALGSRGIDERLHPIDGLFEGPQGI